MAVMKWAIGGSLDIKHTSLPVISLSMPQDGGEVGVKHHKIICIVRNLIKCFVFSKFLALSHYFMP